MTNVCQVTIEIVITTDLLVTVMSDTMTITATPERGRGSATTRTGTGTSATGRRGTETTDTERTGTGTTGEKPCALFYILPTDVMITHCRYERPPRDYYERDRGYDRYGGGGGGHYPSSSSRRSPSPGPPPRY